MKLSTSTMKRIHSPNTGMKPRSSVPTVNCFCVYLFMLLNYTGYISNGRMIVKDEVKRVW